MLVLEEKWARAILATMFPPEASSRTDLGAGFSEIVRGAPFETSVGLRLAIVMVVLAPFVLLKRPRTFASLDTNARERVLEKLMASSVYVVRQLMMALKTMGALLYARDPGMREKLITPKSRDASPQSGLVALSKKGAKSHAA